VAPLTMKEPSVDILDATPLQSFAHAQ
jgi:hypothetical protein